MITKAKRFYGILKIYYTIGVNVIGLPDYHIHSFALTKPAIEEKLWE